MPWTSDDAQSHTSHADTPAKRRQWAAVANERLKAGDKEGAAIRQANAAVHKTENHYMHGETVEKVLKYLADVEPRLAEIMAKEVSETSVEMTLPLLIRLLEYAKEDASADIDLHQIAERASQMAGVLDSDSYSKLVPQDKKNKVTKDMGVGDVHVPTTLGNQGGSTKLSVSFLQALDGQKKAKKVPDAAPAKVIMEKQYPLRITKIDSSQFTRFTRPQMGRKRSAVCKKTK